MINGFKEFILRGNVIDLAVAVVIGAAFTGIVNALVNGIFTPLIGVLFNASDLDGIGPTIREANGDEAALVLNLGGVLASVIQFLLVALVLYFAIVMPMNHVKKIAAAKKEAGQPAVSVDTPPTELELLMDIRDLLANGGTPSGDLHHGKHTD
jgi:large conductance mechanosensitive channel